MTAKRFETKYFQLSNLITVEEAAEILGISSARTRQLIQDSRFKSITQVGARPLNLLNRAEVEEMAKART